ncbi:hypothetical protein [Sinorhizobium psoraleae]|uniref:Uncharacterized protein n=1 Tax=Sinorhizobium psoraleae TaxID=520838 RepID=A0ABT4KB45_9HYPH|nr:hypothetical protein [Sinorhizobium psoraleae]MCZ4089068.1 hypothetical protein [Sinorhizobium psoraleae]
MAEKKKNNDWMNGAVPVSDDEWNQAVPVTDEEWNQIVNSGPNPDLIDDSEDAPALIRAQVGALDKPEDRLKALQKTYPDAKPYGDDNFIFTDEKGKVRLYNQESWMPSLGDFVSIGPEAGETIGGGLGGFFGGLAGAAGGSVVPVVGTGAGAVGGAITGAGAGSVAGRKASSVA